MTWTFNEADLGTEALAKIRNEIGDTQTSDQQLADEQIYRYCGGVISFDIGAGGANYTTASVTVASPTNPSGTTCKATATIAAGAITAIAVEPGYGGSFYDSTNPPLVTITGDGTGAAATANVGEAEANIYMAAGRCAMLVAGLYARKVTTGVGPLRANFSDRYKAYKSLANDLLTRGKKYALPYVGGISQADKESNNSNADNVSPFFYRGIQDNPGVPFTTPDTDSDGDSD